MHLVKGTGAVAALVLGCIVLCGSTQTGNAIRGKLVDANNRGVPQIPVRLETGNGALIGETVTSGEGDFAFSALTGTSYVLTVESVGYQPVRETVEFVNTDTAARPGETRTIVLQLVPVTTSRRVRPAVTFVQDVPEAARKAFERASKFVTEKRHAEAERELKAAIALFPDYFDAHYALANELALVGRNDEAIVELDRARQINPEDDRVYLSFGLVLLEQRKFAVASAVFQEASRLNPTEPQYYVLCATALIDEAARLAGAGRGGESWRPLLERAEERLERAGVLAGERLPMLHLQRARLHERRGERQLAAAALEKYLEQNPKAPNARSIREAIEKLRREQR